MKVPQISNLGISERGWGVGGGVSPEGNRFRS